MTFQVTFIDAIEMADRDAWQRLVASDNPFVSYDYLQALERTGATGEGTGWLPHHALVHDSDSALVAAAPLYIKDNSWGEFVFDFAWAEAHHRHGVAYYPKLVTAVPYTPVAGPRCITGTSANPLAVEALFDAIMKETASLEGSSWHLLFPERAGLEALAKREECFVREDCQFHWFNKNYASFDHFLSHFRSARRKKTRRERRKIAEAGIRMESVSGGDMTEEQWETFYELYASTFYQRGRDPYFTLAFFTTLAQSDQVDIRVCFALREEHTVAASMFFVTGKTLYGRYWGASEFVDGLHFELCYYQGIEFCIEHNLQTFDPGVQGEHKIARGFQATPSWSLHWLRYPPFADAVRNHVKHETGHVREYAEQVDQHLPFRKTPSPD